MRLAIISGRSGSGKTTALRELEDAGYYCIDNLPAGLLPEVLKQTLAAQSADYERLAVCIDARNASSDLKRFAEMMEEIPPEVQTEVIYLDAKRDELIKRFSETRRKHPLSSRYVALQEALEAEKELLAPIANGATLTIGTSKINIYELREIIRQRVLVDETREMAILIESFGFKRGVPGDADIVFDVRCLPNPYWSVELRGKTGLDREVETFLEEQEMVEEMYVDIRKYLEKWLPRFSESKRSYITVGIGCTGGQHRSVYLTERLLRDFSSVFDNVQVRHRELRLTPEVD